MCTVVYWCFNNVPGLIRSSWSECMIIGRLNLSFDKFLTFQNLGETLIDVQFIITHGWNIHNRFVDQTWIPQMSVVVTVLEQNQLKQANTCE
jgi:hypothetical protein